MSVCTRDGGFVHAQHGPAQAHGRAGGELGAVRAAQNGAHAQQQLLGEERLGQVVVRAEAQAEEPVAVGVARGEEERGHVRLGAQLPKEREAVAVGQFDVQHHDVRTLAGKGLPRLAHALRACDVRKARAVQRVREDREQLAAVVHQQDVRFFQGLHRLASLA